MSKGGVESVHLKGERLFDFYGCDMSFIVIAFCHLNEQEMIILSQADVDNVFVVNLHLR